VVLTGKSIPAEISDLAEIVRRECRNFEDLLNNIRYVRTRPYSRIAAIVFDSVAAPTLKDVCEHGPSTPRYSEIGLLYSYVKKLGICGKPKVTVYRAYTEEIKPGDWVYLERRCAEEHAEIHGYSVYEKEVSPEDVIWAGTSEEEWFYVPKKLQGYFTSLEDFWNSVVGDPEERVEEEGEEVLESIRRKASGTGSRRLDRWLRRK